MAPAVPLLGNLGPTEIILMPYASIGIMIGWPLGEVAASGCWPFTPIINGTEGP